MKMDWLIDSILKEKDSIIEYYKQEYGEDLDTYYKNQFEKTKFCFYLDPDFVESYCFTRREDVVKRFIASLKGYQNKIVDYTKFERELLEQSRKIQGLKGFYEKRLHAKIEKIIKTKVVEPSLYYSKNFKTGYIGNFSKENTKKLEKEDISLEKKLKIIGNRMEYLNYVGIELPERLQWNSDCDWYQIPELYNLLPDLNTVEQIEEVRKELEKEYYRSLMDMLIVAKSDHIKHPKYAPDKIIKNKRNVMIIKDDETQTDNLDYTIYCCVPFKRISVFDIIFRHELKHVFTTFYESRETDMEVKTGIEITNYQKQEDKTKDYEELTNHFKLLNEIQTQYETMREIRHFHAKGKSIFLEPSLPIPDKIATTYEYANPGFEIVYQNLTKEARKSFGRPTNEALLKCIPFENLKRIEEIIIKYPLTEEQKNEVESLSKLEELIRRR